MACKVFGQKQWIVVDILTQAVDRVDRSLKKIKANPVLRCIHSVRGGAFVTSIATSSSFMILSPELPLAWETRFCGRISAAGKAE